MSNVNERLYEMRKHLKATQQEFGDVGGVSQSTQNRYEHAGTDVPISYLEKIFSEFGHHFNEDWLYFGRGAMLQHSAEPSSSSIQSPGNTSNTQLPTPLSLKESQIVAEVGRFSDFLKKRPLRPEVKRHLLQLLIESIDQELEKLHNDGRAET